MLRRSTAKWSGYAILALMIGGAVLPAFGQNETKVGDLLREFREAYEGREWPRAIELGLQVEALRPDRPGHQYNMACVFSLSGDTEKGLFWLSSSAANGLSNLELVEGDDDLAALREEEGFARVLEQVELNIKEDRAELVRRFEAAPPLIVAPPDHDPAKPAPLVIALHGFGGEAKGHPMWWQGATARVGAILMAPQAVRPHENGGWAWDNVWQTEEILDLAMDYVRERFEVDPSRIVLTGFSQGAYFAMALGIRHPDRFAGVVPMAGAFDEERDTPPPPPETGSPRYYFMVGARDDNRGQVLVAARTFEDAGYDVKLQVYPKVGHTFPLSTDKVLSKVLRHVLEDKR